MKSGRTMPHRGHPAGFFRLIKTKKNKALKNFFLNALL